MQPACYLHGEFNETSTELQKSTSYSLSLCEISHQAFTNLSSISCGQSNADGTVQILYTIENVYMVAEGG